jgi:hypothetical protein
MQEARSGLTVAILYFSAFDINGRYFGLIDVVALIKAMLTQYRFYHLY